jgi:hypothetical protein
MKKEALTLNRHHRMNDAYASFQEDVVALATTVCGEDASQWSTQLHVIQKMQSSHVWELWVRSGLTREQFVQFVHRLRIKKMKGDLTFRKLSPQHFSPALAFAVPSGWRVLVTPPSERVAKDRRMVAHWFSGRPIVCFSVRIPECYENYDILHDHGLEQTRLLCY